MILDTAFCGGNIGDKRDKGFSELDLGNWVRRLPPRVSAVIPVLSEIKKTFLLVKITRSL